MAEGWLTRRVRRGSPRPFWRGGERVRVRVGVNPDPTYCLMFVATVLS